MNRWMFARRSWQGVKASNHAKAIVDERAHEVVCSSTSADGLHHVRLDRACVDGSWSYTWGSIARGGRDPHADAGGGQRDSPFTTTIRGGHNPNEAILKPANVTSKNFGKLFSFPVDGYLYADPLYVSGLAIPGRGTFNVVFVASEHDSVYAFDADGIVSSPLWQTSFINPGAGITTVDALHDIGCSNLVPEIGITGTPVISLENQALYVVFEVKNQNNDTYMLQLHALDLATGSEKFGGPARFRSAPQLRAPGPAATVQAMYSSSPNWQISVPRYCSPTV